MQGINLNIDQSVTEICKVCSLSHTDTRRLIYLLLTFTIFYLTILLNSNRYSWSNIRKQVYQEKMEFVRKELAECKTHADSININDRIQLIQLTRERLLQKRIDGSLVTLPIVNLSIDINDIGIIAGFTFIVLLLLLIFTLDRTYKCLEISFRTISERYRNNSDRLDISSQLEKVSEEDESLMLSEYNFNRRKYHYKYLQINEQLNIGISDSVFSKGRTWILLIIFSVPFFLFIIYFIWDLSSYSLSPEVGQTRAYAQLLIYSLFCIILTRLSILVNRRLRKIKSYFEIFEKDNFFINNNGS